MRGKQIGVPGLLLASVASTAGLLCHSGGTQLRPGAWAAPAFSLAPAPEPFRPAELAGAVRRTQCHGRVAAPHRQPLRLASAGVRSIRAIMTPKEALDVYTDLLVTAPIPTKVATAAVLGGAGDFVAQLAESATKSGSTRRKLDLDPIRALSMIAFSAIYTGAFQAWWISTLQAEVHLSNQVLDAAVKTGLCQFGTIPLVYMPTFFLVTGAVRGMDLQASLENGKQNYLRIYSRNVLYWIPVQMCQFLYVPQEWQIPFLCAGGFIWSVILSTLALQQGESQQTPEGMATSGLLLEQTSIPSEHSSEGEQLEGAQGRSSAAREKSPV